MNLKEEILKAEKEGRALGHFNISDIAALKAIFETAQELSVPVIIGTSEGEREFIGPGEAGALISEMRDEHSFPIFLNADHTHSFEKIKEAVEAGYDAVLFDGGKLSLEENIRETKKVVEYVKSVNPDIVVEGELGYIGSSSEVLKKLPEGAALRPEDLTSPEDAKRFVLETGVDLLAPAVGNIHGLIDGGNPKLDIERIKEIKEAVKIPLVLHGGSGISDEDFKAAISAGISIVHINTEIRVAWREGMEEALEEHKDTVTPYKLYPEAIKNIKEVVNNRLRLFLNK